MAKTGEGEQQRRAMERDVAASLARAGGGGKPHAMLDTETELSAAWTGDCATQEAKLLSQLLVFFSRATTPSTVSSDAGEHPTATLAAETTATAGGEALVEPCASEQTLVAAFLAAPRASQQKLAQSLFVAPDALVHDFAPVLQFFLRVMMAAHAVSHAHSLISSPEGEEEFASGKAAKSDQKDSRACSWAENATVDCMKLEQDDSGNGGGATIAFQLPAAFHACLVEHYGSVKRLKCEEVWHGDHMAYRCRTCGLSDSSCMCLACFDPDEHEGHDYRVYRCSSGGCCDCGDPLAWKPEGFCKKHSAQRAAAANAAASGAQTPTKMRMDPEEDAVVKLLMRRAMDFCVLVLREVYQACLKPSTCVVYDNGHPLYPVRTLPKTGQRLANLPTTVEAHVKRLQQTLAWLQMLAMSCLHYRDTISSMFFEELPASFKLESLESPEIPLSPSAEAPNQTSEEQYSPSEACDAGLETSSAEGDEDGVEQLDKPSETHGPLLILDVFLKAGILLPVETCDVLGVLYLKLLFDQDFKQRYTCHFVEWYPYFIELYLAASDESNEDGMRNLSRFIDRLFCQLFHSNAQLRELEAVFASMHETSSGTSRHQRPHHRFGIPALASSSASSSCVEWLMVFLLEKLNDLFRSTLRLAAIQRPADSAAKSRRRGTESAGGEYTDVGGRSLSDPDAPKSLRAIQVVDCGHNVFKKRIYARLCSDLRTLLVHPQIAAEVLLRSFRCIGGDECLLRETSVYAQLMKTFELLQQMDLQRRHLHRHIEYESQNWTFAFVADYELKLLLGAFLTGIPACFETEVWQNITGDDSAGNQGAMGVITGGTPLNPLEKETFRPLTLARALLQPVRASLTQWAHRHGRPELAPESIEATVLAMETVGTESGDVAAAATPVTVTQLMEYYERGTVVLGGASSKSFHLPLHHMYTALVHSLCAVVRPQTLVEWRELLGMGVATPANVVSSEKEEEEQKRDLAFWYSALDHPLRVLLFSREIKGGLWVRNGNVMLQQLIHYHSKHWRFFGLHSDLFLCQLGASLLPHGSFARLFFHQLPFEVQRSRVFMLDGAPSGVNPDAEDIIATATGTSDQSRELRQEVDVAEEALRLLLQLVLAPVKLALSSTPITSAVGLLEREMMHWLTLGPSTRSEVIMRTDMKLVEQIKQLPEHEWAELEEEEILSHVLERIGVYDDPTMNGSTSAARSGNVLGYGLKMSGSWKLKPELWTRVSPLFECFTPSEAQQCEQNIRKNLHKPTGTESNSSSAIASTVLPMLPQLQQGEGGEPVNMHALLAETTLNSSYVMGALLIILENSKCATTRKQTDQRQDADCDCASATTNENLLLAALHCLYVAVQMTPSSSEELQENDTSRDEECASNGTKRNLSEVANYFQEDSSLFMKLCTEIPVGKWAGGDNCTTGEDQTETRSRSSLLSLLMFFADRSSAMEDTRSVVELILRVVRDKSPSCADYLDTVKRREGEARVKSEQANGGASSGQQCSSNSRQNEKMAAASAKEMMKKRQQQILEKMRSQQMQFLSSNGDAQKDGASKSDLNAEPNTVPDYSSSDEYDDAMASDSGSVDNQGEEEEEDDEWGFPTGQVDVSLYLDHVSSAIALTLEKQRKTQDRRRRRRRSTRSSSFVENGAGDETGRSSCASHDSNSGDGLQSETEECGLCRLPCDSRTRGSSFGFVGMILPTNMPQKMDSGFPNVDPDGNTAVDAVSSSTLRPQALARSPSLRVLKPGTTDEMRLQLSDAVIWSCGHAIHHACLKSYLLSLWKQKQGRNPLDGASGEDRLLSERDLEFVCPICRRLSNCLVPRVSLADLRQQVAGVTSPTSVEFGSDEEEEETKDDGQDPLAFLQWVDTQMSYRDDSPVVKRRRSRAQSSMRLRRRLQSSASTSPLSPASRSSSGSQSRSETETNERDMSVEREIGAFCHEIILRCVRAQLHLPTLLTGVIRDEAGLDLEMQQLSSECGAQTPAWQLLLRCLEVQLRVVVREQTLLHTAVVDSLQLRSMRQLADVAAAAAAFSTPSSLAWTVVEAPAEKQFESVMARLNGLLFGQQVLFEEEDDGSTMEAIPGHLLSDRDDATEEALVGTPVLSHPRLLTCFSMRMIWRQGISTPNADVAAEQLLSEAFFSARVLLTAQVLQALAYLRIQEEVVSVEEGDEMGDAEGKAEPTIGDFEEVESLRDASAWISQVLIRSRLVNRKPQRQASRATRWDAATVEEQVSAVCLPLAQQMLLLMDVMVPTPSLQQPRPSSEGESGGSMSQDGSETCAVCDGLFPSSPASSKSSSSPSASAMLATCLRKLHLPPLRLFFHRQMFPSSQRALCQLWGAQLEAKAAVSRQQARMKALTVFGSQSLQTDGFPLREQIMALSSHAAGVITAGANQSFLVPLPRVYMDLFIRYNEKPAGVCSRCAQVPQHPGLCLFCGEVLCCFSVCCEAKEGGGVGECSQHAQRCGLGLGAFLLLRACTVILFLGNERRCVWGSLYVDKNGEEDPYLRRGKTLYLDASRRLALETLLVSHGYSQNTAILQNTSRRDGRRY